MIVTRPLNDVELANATLTVVRLVQQEALSEAMKRLVNMSSSESSDRLMTDKTLRNAMCFKPLQRLSPFKLNVVMRMDGRL